MPRVATGMLSVMKMSTGIRICPVLLCQSVAIRLCETFEAVVGAESETRHGAVNGDGEKKMSP